jgi:tetratricopeptide (TPR) repeat protein
MAFKNYESNFTAVLPRMRSVAEISADVELRQSGRATDIARSGIAAIELRIRNADDLYQRQQYEPALQEFRRARASIYALLYPAFNVNAYVNAIDRQLPASKALEGSLLEVSVGLADSMRPLEVESSSPARPVAVDPPPEALTPFVQGGFREAVTADESLQTAAAQGVSLLADGKPEAAITVLSGALVQRNGGAPDQTLVAAVHLNLASAFVQAGDPARGIESAKKAQELFRGNKDSIGIAQALHGQAVATLRNGDRNGAQQLFAQAAETLKGAPAGNQGANGGLARAGGANAALASRDPEVLQPIARMDATALTLRVPGRADGWTAVAVADDTQQRQRSKTWLVGVPVGQAMTTFKVASGGGPAPALLVAQIYQRRARAAAGADLDWQIVDTSTTTFYLTQLYAYALAVKIGDCYHQLGRYANAETYYQQASAYSFINTDVEATSLWLRIARNSVEWGEALYKNEDHPGATAQYSKVIRNDATVPNSLLYAAGVLVTPANAARAFIGNILQRPLPAVNWEIAYLVMTAFSRLQQLAQGLDFYGLMLSPIHTFEYLQSIARGFAQGAIQAEREFVNFKSRQEGEEATRRELETATAMAAAEAESRRLLHLAAQDDQTAADNALALSTRRRDDAVVQRAGYAASSSEEIWARAAATAVGSGEDAWPEEIGELANRYGRGETVEGPRGKLAAAVTLYAGQRTQEYELQRMQHNVDELNDGIVIATNQRDASRNRTAAAEVLWQASLQRAAMAAASLTAFDDNFFTPEAWSRMADVMRDISRSYLYQAIRIAKLMERAYNFENDTDLRVIRNDYGIGIANAAPGRDTRLLGGDMLLLDVESFTYTAIASKTRKSSRIKDTLSMAATFPAQFEEFRRTGLLSIETELYELDRLHPGFFGQRIEAVEVEIIGLLPEGGLNGTLTAGGVTSFRRRNNTAGKRTHQIDTMALSAFSLRNDTFLYGTETGVRGLFQGLGVGSTWQLHLPKRSNAFDYRRIFDVNLILYYNAQFDAPLRTAVLAAPPRPGETKVLRTLALRYDFPEAWYAFYRTGTARFVLDRFRLPANQTAFLTQMISFRVVTREGVNNQNIRLRITAPNGAVGEAVTNASGLVSSRLPALAALAGQTPVGTWQVEVLAGPSLMDGATLRLDRVYNIQVGLEYTFAFVPEVI